jgi:pyridoxine 4-dehydrogenase
MTSDQLRAARQIVEITAVLAHFNVVARQAAPLLDAALDGGAVFVPWQPVSLMTPRAPSDTAGPEAVRNVLAPIATRLGASISQITRVATGPITGDHAHPRHDEHHAPPGKPRCARHQTES